MARKPAVKPAAPRRTRYQVADTLGEAAAVALAQQALDGNRPLPASPQGAARTLLWDDHGDRALVHVAPAAVDIEDAAGQVIETRFVPVRGTAHSAATDLLTSLLAAL